MVQANQLMYSPLCALTPFPGHGSGYSTQILFLSKFSEHNIIQSGALLLYFTSPDLWRPQRATVGNSSMVRHNNCWLFQGCNKHYLKIDIENKFYSCQLVSECSDTCLWKSDTCMVHWKWIQLLLKGVSKGTSLFWLNMTEKTAGFSSGFNPVICMRRISHVLPEKLHLGSQW